MFNGKVDRNVGTMKKIIEIILYKDSNRSEKAISRIRYGYHRHHHASECSFFELLHEVDSRMPLERTVGDHVKYFDDSERAAKVSASIFPCTS